MHIKNCFLLFASLIFLTPDSADAIAYCALRDPVRTIDSLYPESNRYSSIVKPVDRKARDEVGKKLPFTLHFNELGKHTVYVALKNDKPLGVIHVRSELSDWGLIEIAWALNMDMTVKALHMQRCRNPGCNELPIKSLISELSGKSFDELLNYLDTNTAQKNALQLSIIKSALKTIAVTDIVWGEEISKIQRRHIVNNTFNTNKHTKIVPAKVSPQSISKLNTQFGKNDTLIIRDSAKIYKIVDMQKNIGNLVEASWKQGKHQGKFTWLYSTDGTVLAIYPKTPWPNNDIKSSFKELIGTNIKNSQCSTAAQIASHELYLLSQ